MTQEEKNIKICEALGWRRWKFGDPWVKGLRLADNRFGGYIRVCIANACPSSQYVKLDIDETPTQSSVEVINNYEPRSHWVLGEKIHRRLPNHFTDLNAMHEAERWAYEKQPPGWSMSYNENLRLVTAQSKDPLEYHWAWHANAAQRAEAFGLTLNLWNPED